MDLESRNYLYKELEKCGALKNGHFELSSGRHSNQYVQCAQFCKFPHLNKWAAFNISLSIQSKPDFVVSPAIGGMIIGYEVARQLEIPFLFVEREKGVGPMRLRRDFKIKNNANVLIVEDVITTGKSVLEVDDVIKKNKASTASVACIIDRSNGSMQPEFKDFLSTVQFTSLLTVEASTYDKNECPLCVEGSNAVKPGSRYE